ncbi:Beta-hexosaminidase [hydrothermal vent metagenome]|uniref:beta-N-acetylhexosaminidase n=1 Tax=hydrothermal vent metagenome TaxID=652676 RepID=A0A3B0U9U0_9ZZZZ
MKEYENKAVYCQVLCVLKNYLYKVNPITSRLNSFKLPYILLSVILTLNVSNSFGFINDLGSNGYSLIPAPQESVLTGRDIVVDESWGIYTSVDSNSIVLKRLRHGAKELHNLKFTGVGAGKIILKLTNDAVAKDLNPKQGKQAYRINIEHNVIRISSSAEMGLFYGVQSLLQLLRPVANGGFNLPEGVIADWPDLELRVVHWDTKHHQDRIGVLKRYLDWAAFFKVNAVAFEIEDKYEYPSHPIIGAPGAFTKEQMHELTAYAMERYIQLIPSVQAPSHMAYVLKHEQFAHLRADDSNYHICMCNEDAMQLIFDMYQDMIDATPGVNYFFVSTDEVYYAGICELCGDEYNEENRSKIWVKFVNRVHKWMAKRGREMIAWVEYPLFPEHIELLPAGLIDGIMTQGRSTTWIENENKAGIKQLAYSSIQGGEYLFPNYFPTIYRNKQTEGRLAKASNTVPGVKAKGANPIGAFAAAWDDAGLHNETFWLGWATVIQYAWSTNKPSLEQNTIDFMNAYYGYESPYLAGIYKSLQKGARFYENLWDKRISTERKPGYGSSYGKGIGTEKSDPYMEMPDLPSASDLSRGSVFLGKYAKKITAASVLKPEIDELINKLFYAISHVSRNRYNLEVFLSIAYLEKYTINTVLRLGKIDNYLAKASEGNLSNKEKIQQLVEAFELGGQILSDEQNMWSSFQEVWGKSRFEKGQSVGGRDFVHILDDVKDHFADRRVGLDYMLAPFERMEMKEWQNQLRQVIISYAEKNNEEVKGMEVKRLED